VERFFRTVRMRFLNRMEPEKIKSLEELNLRFWQWLEKDYQRKIHSSLNMSPLDYFMSQANMFPDPALLDEYFLLRNQRKINHDATFSLENVLYETDRKLANTRLEPGRSFCTAKAQKQAEPGGSTYLKMPAQKGKGAGVPPNRANKRTYYLSKQRVKLPNRL